MLLKLAFGYFPDFALLYFFHYSQHEINISLLYTGPILVHFV